MCANYVGSQNPIKITWCVHEDVLELRRAPLQDGQHLRVGGWVGGWVSDLPACREFS